jgi:type IV pilus assembly protein PilV
MLLKNVRDQSGFGLVESLVALVVISVGMIGIAALYGQGLRASTTAFYRIQAVNLAADMADRIRVNRRAGAAYNGPAANTPKCDPGGAADCTPAEMAAHDLFVWQTQVGATLPGGVGLVARIGTTPPTYTITINWQEPGGPVPPYQVALRVPNL